MFSHGGFDMSRQEYDYIIVGGGSAGCVVATRLIEQNAGTVLLLEAGGPDSSLFHRIPATVVKVFQQKSWPYMTVPQPHCNGREMIIAQGKVLGGGSSVNGMIYIRGQQEDFDEWAVPGWGARDVLPYFKFAEDNESLSGEYHRSGGYLAVSENRFRHPMTQAFVRAGQEMGLAYVNDFNGASQQGVGYYQTTTRSGERCSTSKAYLKRVQGNSKLTVITGALTHKVLLSEGRATGVEFSEKQGGVQTVLARKEVILSAGAFGSPKILMLSGIGPKEHLSKLGIETLIDLPVGKNLHDHLHMSLNATTHASNSLLGEDKGLRAISHMFQWAAFRSGLLTTNVLEGGAFIDSLGVGRPDIQLMFLPVLDNFDNTPGEKPPAQEHGLTVKTGHVRPEARGQLRLRSKDPQEHPLIDPNYLGTQADLEGQIRAVQVGLRLMEQPSLKALIKKVIAPEEMDWRDTRALEAFVRQNIKTVYHPTGTCRLGQDRTSSVTDLDLRVHGVPNLRVVDLSVCPMVTSGNTNATAIMIGERGAAEILGQPLAVSKPEPVREPASCLNQG